MIKKVYGTLRQHWELFWMEKAELKVICNYAGFLEKTKKQIISQLLWKELSLYLHWQVLQSSRHRCTERNSRCWGPNIQSIHEILIHTSSSLFLYTDCLVLVRVHEVDACNTSFNGVSSHMNLICELRECSEKWTKTQYVSATTWFSPK